MLNVFCVAQVFLEVISINILSYLIVWYFIKA